MSEFDKFEVNLTLATFPAATAGIFPQFLTSHPFARLCLPKSYAEAFPPLVFLLLALYLKNGPSEFRKSGLIRTGTKFPGALAPIRCPIFPRSPKNLRKTLNKSDPQKSKFSEGRKSASSRIIWVKVGLIESL